MQSYHLSGVIGTFSYLVFICLPSVIHVIIRSCNTRVIPRTGCACQNLTENISSFLSKFYQKYFICLLIFLLVTLPVISVVIPDRTVHGTCWNAFLRQNLIDFCEVKGVHSFCLSLFVHCRCCLIFVFLYHELQKNHLSNVASIFTEATHNV